MQMIKLFNKIEERENKVFAFIPGLKSVVFPLSNFNGFDNSISDGLTFGQFLISANKTLSLLLYGAYR